MVVQFFLLHSSAYLTGMPILYHRLVELSCSIFRSRTRIQSKKKKVKSQFHQSVTMNFEAIICSQRKSSPVLGIPNSRHFFSNRFSIPVEYCVISRLVGYKLACWKQETYIIWPIFHEIPSPEFLHQSRFWYQYQAQHQSLQKPYQPSYSRTLLSLEMPFYAYAISVRPQSFVNCPNYLLRWQF